MIETREREQEVIRLRKAGVGFDEIAAQVGYNDESSARSALKRGLSRRVDEDIDSFRYAEELKYDDWERKLLEIFHGAYITASFGKVVTDPRTGAPVADLGPNLSAARQLIALAERRSKLRGGDAPFRKVLSIITDDVVQAEIRRVSQMADELEAAEKH